jgi:hypothetical protein
MPSGAAARQYRFKSAAADALRYAIAPAGNVRRWIDHDVDSLLVIAQRLEAGLQPRKGVAADKQVSVEMAISLLAPSP